MISSELLKKFYDYLSKNGHPDPVGALARTAKLSDFKDSYQKMNHKGMFAIPVNQATALGIEDIDSSPSAALGAVLAIDVENMIALDGDIVKMHQAWLKGVEVTKRSRVAKKFVDNLNSNRDEINKLLGITSTDIEMPDELTPHEAEIAAAVASDGFTVQKVYTNSNSENPLKGLLEATTGDSAVPQPVEPNGLIPEDQDEREIEALIQLIKSRR